MCLAIPGRVAEIRNTDPAMPLAKVDFGGVVKEVCLAYTPEARVGDYVIVHVGFAISVLDEEEARRVFAYLEEIDGLEELQAGEPPVALEAGRR